MYLYVYVYIMYRHNEQLNNTLHAMIDIHSDISCNFAAKSHLNIDQQLDIN